MQIGQKVMFAVMKTQQFLDDQEPTVEELQELLKNTTVMMNTAVKANMPHLADEISALVDKMLDMLKRKEEGE